MFYALSVLAALLSVALLHRLVAFVRARDPRPEVALCRRAWAATRRVSLEATATGPLFRHIPRAARMGLRCAGRAGADIGARRARFGPAAIPLGCRELVFEFSGRQRAAVQELRHLVEQLELLARLLTRYRVGLGRLYELELPLRCIDDELDAGAARSA